MNVIRWTAAAALLAATLSGCTNLPGYAGAGSGVRDTVRTDVRACDLIGAADLRSIGLDPTSAHAPSGQRSPTCTWAADVSGSPSFATLSIVPGTFSAAKSGAAQSGARTSPAGPIDGHEAIRLDAGGRACALTVKLDDDHVLSVVDAGGRCATMAELAIRNLSA